MIDYSLYEIAVGDMVTFGIRASDMRVGKRRADGKNGGILRLDGVVVSMSDKLIVVKHLGGQYAQYQERLYNLRKLKNGWVVEGERDDPWGRMHLRAEVFELAV